MLRFIVIPALFFWGVALPERVTAQFISVGDSLQLETNHTSGYLGSGISVVDFNGDGVDDLTFCHHQGGLYTYVGDGAGGFEQVDLGISNGNADAKSVSWVDLDNDGDQDLFITNRMAKNRLWRNLGEEGFLELTDFAGLNQDDRKSYAASFADFDNDGDLDLFVANYNWAMTEMLNELYTNNGDGTFTEVTFEAGFGEDIKQSFIGEWTDLNEDGLLDLYLIRDRHVYLNKYYQNQGDGTFVDVAAEMGLDASLNAMCSGIGDYNRDGAMDVYVSGLQNENVLLTNDGTGNFSDLGSDAFDIWHTCWAGTWIDWDNNGWQELHIASGTSMYTNYPAILSNPVQIPDSLYEYVDGEWGAIANSGLEAEHGFSIAATDLNGDGFLDLVSNPIGELASIYLATPNDNNYLKVMGVGVQSNRDAIGVKYRAYVDGEVTYKMSKSGEGYLTQGSRWQHFGLGDATSVDSLVMTWPSGTVQVFEDVPANSALVVTEGEADWVCWSGACALASASGCTYAVALNYDADALEDDGSCEFGPNPASCGQGTTWDESTSTCIALAPTCPGDVNGDFFVGIADLLEVLESFATECPE